MKNMFPPKRFMEQPQNSEFSSTFVLKGDFHPAIVEPESTTLSESTAHLKVKNCDESPFQFYIISTTYLVFTITDSCLRMIVLFQLYQLKFSILQIATIFTFYELVGVFTKLKLLI